MSNFPSVGGYPQSDPGMPVLIGGGGPAADGPDDGRQRDPKSGGGRFATVVMMAAILALTGLLLYLLYALILQYAPEHLRPGQVIGRSIGDTKEAYDRVTGPTAAALQAKMLEQENAAKIQIQDMELRMQERLKVLDAQLDIAKQAAAKNFEIAAQYQKLNADMLNRMAQVRIDQYQSQEAGRAAAIMFYDIAGAMANITGRSDYAATIEQQRNRTQTSSINEVRNGMQDVFAQISTMNPVGTLVSPAQLNQQLVQSPSVVPFPHAASAPTLQGGPTSPFRKVP